MACKWFLSRLKVRGEVREREREREREVARRLLRVPRLARLCKVPRVPRISQASSKCAGVIYRSAAAFPAAQLRRGRLQRAVRTFMNELFLPSLGRDSSRPSDETVAGAPRLSPTYLPTYLPHTRTRTHAPRRTPMRARAKAQTRSRADRAAGPRAGGAWCSPAVLEVRARSGGGVGGGPSAILVSRARGGGTGRRTSYCASPTLGRPEPSCRYIGPGAPSFFSLSFFISGPGPGCRAPAFLLGRSTFGLGARAPAKISITSHAGKTRMISLDLIPRSAEYLSAIKDRSRPIAFVRRTMTLFFSLARPLGREGERRSPKTRTSFSSCRRRSSNGISRLPPRLILAQSGSPGLPAPGSPAGSALFKDALL
jgi:hypothetical protein